MFPLRARSRRLAALAVLSLLPVGAQSLDSLARRQDFETRRASSSDPNLEGNGDARPIEPGATLVVADLEGPGVIKHLWFTVAAQDPLYGRSLVLRMYWDDAAAPSVEAPLGDFFALGNGAHATVNSIPVAVSAEGRAKNCYWRMPFRRHARITVTNESKTDKVWAFFYYVDWEKHKSLPADIAYFHARYRQASPAAPGEYVVLDTAGEGHYVGTVYSVFQLDRGWFGEGDDRFYIDGETSPSMRGTGTEDYFCDSWGFRRFTNPYYGVPVWESFDAGARVTAYRWHVADPVAFRKSLRVALEHKGQIRTEDGGYLSNYEERPDWVSSVAFWYQTTPAPASQPMPAASERIPPYRRLSGERLAAKSSPGASATRKRGTITFSAAKPGDWIDIGFDVPSDGRYQVNAAFAAQDSGLYEVSIDGRTLPAPADLWMESWGNFGLHHLYAGSHTLKLRCAGRSPGQTGVLKDALEFSLQALYLLRMEDLAGYAEVSGRLMKAGGK